MKKYISIILTGILLSVLPALVDGVLRNQYRSKPCGWKRIRSNLILPTVSFNYGGMMTGYSGAPSFQSMWVQVMLQLLQEELITTPMPINM